MTEPTEAAKLKARELYRDIWPDSASYQHDYTSARRWSATLARYIQNTSDVAKQADRGFDKCGYGDAPGSLRHKIKSLILDDEPCKHTVSYIWIGGDLASNYCGIRCSKCGTRLKIVEVGDD